jgi:hypothetical protein
MFAFFGANLGRQFEFVQSEWMNDGSFFGGGATKDPVAGANSGAGAYSFPRRPLPRASKDCLGLLSQGEASIAFCPASAHCDGWEGLSPRRRIRQLSGSVRSARLVNMEVIADLRSADRALGSLRAEAGTGRAVFFPRPILAEAPFLRCAPHTAYRIYVRIRQERAEAVVVGNTRLQGFDPAPGSYESPKGFCILLEHDSKALAPTCRSVSPGKNLIIQTHA